MSNLLIKFVLKRVSGTSQPVIGNWELAEYPDLEVRVLIRAGILKETEAASEVPRLESMPPGPPLHVRRTRRGLYGVADEDGFHEPLSLTEDDIRQYEVDPVAIARCVSKDNDLSGTAQAINAGLVFVGEKRLPSGRTVRCVFAPHLTKGREILVAAREIKVDDSVPVILIVPLTPALKSEARAVLRLLNTTIVSLESHVQPTYWALPWEEILPAAMLSPDEGPIPRDAVCRMITNQSNEYIDLTRYRVVAAAAQRFDIFVDGRARQCHGLSTSQSRRRGGVSLSERERDLLCEYMSDRRGIRISDTAVAKRVDYDAANKAFETARSKVDRSLRRYDWMCFKREKGYGERSKSFRFEPPEGETYCVLIPVPSASAATT